MPRSRSELTEVGIARPKRDNLRCTSMLLEDYLFVLYVLVLIHTGLSLTVKKRV